MYGEGFVDLDLKISKYFPYQLLLKPKKVQGGAAYRSQGLEDKNLACSPVPLGQ